jgi:hypothetical protein
MKCTNSTYLALVTILFSPMAANAGPIEIEVGMANILGTDYSVSLLADDGGDLSLQSFNALAPTITFTTLTDAMAAGAALISAFGADFDWSPFIGTGAEYPTGGRIAYESDATSYSYVTINDLNPGDQLGPFTTSRDAGNYFSYIQFSTVPEPGTLALLGIGLFGMGLARRKKV